MADSALDFSISPTAQPGQEVNQVTTMVRMTLPMFLVDVPEQAAVCAAVEAVVTELVDIAARHRASADLVGRVAFDGTHVTVSVGDMAGPLPAPEQEPGLYLVHRLADDVGQYDGDFGGRVTWAALPVAG
ncbi:hypothetical protein AB0O57_29560 [Streptomyces sp. NPDC091201]|uniref:hypothetical protein n=1 Tax=Streptomyces sp. NPDC091201 TaxID=3155190 RepID=UPI00343966A3